MKPIIKSLSHIVAVGFMVVMLEILWKAFFNPDYRELVGEPNRLVSGLEIGIGLFAIIFLLKETYEINNRSH